MYKVYKTIVSPDGIEKSELLSTDDYEVARFFLLKKHSRDLNTYEGRPFYRTRDEYVIKPDKYTSIDVRIEVI